MKDGFIRIKDNNDIFYDSIEKVCRYRMHCSECEKLIPTCRCYHDLDCLLIDIEEGIADYTCSAKCCLVGGDWDELGEAMQEIGHGGPGMPLKLPTNHRYGKVEIRLVLGAGRSLVQV